MRLLFVFVAILLAPSFLFSQKEEKLPKKTRTSVPLLTQYIIQNCSNEREKVDAIHTWITENIEYDYKRIEQSTPFTYQSSETTLKTKKAICTSYCQLMQEMLAEAGIKSEVVEGYIRKDEPGFKEVIFSDSHAWIAIHINDQWQLADPTWDAGYIGRIPKKEKTYPKSWTKERSFKTDDKRVAWEKKIEEKKKKFDEKMESWDPYTDKIGFVSNPTQTYYLIPADSFLLTHLPTLPQWQLRNQAISIEQFSTTEDSIKIALNTPQGPSQEYTILIEDYLNKNFIQKWLFTAEKGLEYNPQNHGVVALNNYNTVGVYLDSDLKKILKRYPDENVQPLWSELLPMTDTAIVHAKLAGKRLKVSEKSRTKYYKDSFKSESNAHKAIGKEIAKVEKSIEKTEKKIVSSNERLKNDIKSFAEKISKYQSYVSKVDISKVKLQSDIPEIQKIYDSYDSLIYKVDSIHKAIKTYRTKSAQQGFLDAINEGNHHVFYSNSYVSLFTIGTLDSVHYHDSLATQFLQNAQKIVEDSLYHEIQTKELVTAIKEMDKFVKSKKTTLRELEANGTIKRATSIEKVLLAVLTEKLKEHGQFMYTSRAYHNHVKENLKIIGGAINRARTNWESLEKSREKRDEQLLKELETDYDRGENLYKLIQSNSKVWKTELKKRLE